MNLGNISSVQSMSRFLKSRNLVTNLDGKLFKVLPPYEYKLRFLKLMALIMVGFVAHIIKRFPYRPITIMGNTVYCHVVASCLSRNNIPYIMCKGTNRIPYYEIENGDEIAFEGPSAKIFINEQSDKVKESLVPLIPLSIEEIGRLEGHTKLPQLEYIQNKILESFTLKDGVYLSTMKDLVNYERNKIIPGAVINIRRFFGGLYYIMTTNEIWISRLVITDNVLPLQPGEIISSLSGTTILESHDRYSINKTNTTCTINELDRTTILTRNHNYQINTDLTIIKPPSDKSLEFSNESVLYNLKHPRPFIHNSAYVIHPFHLPESWDPFLSIIIVSCALIYNMK